MSISLATVVTLPQATAELQRLRADLGSRPGPWVIDAAGLGQLDSSCIAVLLQCRRDAQARGVELQITGMPPKLSALLALYGVSDLFSAR